MHSPMVSALAAQLRCLRSPICAAALGKERHAHIIALHVERWRHEAGAGGNARGVITRTATVPFEPHLFTLQNLRVLG